MLNIGGRGNDQFMVRFPTGMRDEIKSAAREAGRSMNSEIIWVLSRYYAGLTATGAKFGDQTPAAVSHTSARESADISTNGL